MTVSRGDIWRRPDWRKPSLAGVSVVLNGALIAVLSLTALGVRDDRPAVPPPPIYLDIEPRPLLPDERPRAPVAARARDTARTARTQDAAPTYPSSAPTQDRPAPLRPRIPEQPPAGAPPPEETWRVNPSDNRAAMARSLRLGAAGCGAPELLNEMERRHCRERFGERAAAAPPITGTGNPERDAAFARQGARRLAQWEAQRRPLSGGVGVVGPADCVGSNFGTGCAGAHLDPSLAPDSTRPIRTRRDGPPPSGVPLTPGSSGPGRE
jgi:hypothetical protein